MREHDGPVHWIDDDMKQPAVASTIIFAATNRIQWAIEEEGYEVTQFPVLTMDGTEARLWNE